MRPKGPPTNLAAFVRARLRDLARTRGVEFQFVLSDFAIERLLYRLGARVDASVLVEDLRSFLMPVLAAAARGVEYASTLAPRWAVGPFIDGANLMTKRSGGDGR